MVRLSVEVQAAQSIQDLLVWMSVQTAPRGSVQAGPGTMFHYVEDVDHVAEAFLDLRLFDKPWPQKRVRVYLRVCCKEEYY